MPQIRETAFELAAQLESSQTSIVFAESCTAGLVAASLAQVPGISRWLCGSAVTYQESVKIAWLDVAKSDLQKHTAVSDVVTRQMAIGVLKKTPHANISAAVTGHLGPLAPKELDGVGFVAIAIRRQNVVQANECQCIADSRFELRQQSRVDRQYEAAAIVLEFVLKSIERHLQRDSGV